MWINVNDERPAHLIPVLIILQKGTYAKYYREITGYLSESGHWWGFNASGSSSPIPDLSGQLFREESFEKIEVLYWQHIEPIPEHLSKKMQEDATNLEEK